MGSRGGVEGRGGSECGEGNSSRGWELGVRLSGTFVFGARPHTDTKDDLKKWLLTVLFIATDNAISFYCRIFF